MEGGGLVIYWPRSGRALDGAAAAALFGWQSGGTIVITVCVPLHGTTAAAFAAVLNGPSRLQPLGLWTNSAGVAPADEATLLLLDELRHAACKDPETDGAWLVTQAAALYALGPHLTSGPPHSLAISAPNAAATPAVNLASIAAPVVLRVEDSRGAVPPGHVSIVVYDDDPPLTRYPRYCCADVDASARLDNACEARPDAALAEAKSLSFRPCVGGFCARLNGARREADDAAARILMAASAPVVTAAEAVVFSGALLVFPTTPDPTASPANSLRHRRWGRSSVSSPAGSSVGGRSVAPSSEGPLVRDPSGAPPPQPLLVPQPPSADAAECTAPLTRKPWRYAGAAANSKAVLARMLVLLRRSATWRQLAHRSSTLWRSVGWCAGGRRRNTASLSIGGEFAPCYPDSPAAASAAPLEMLDVVAIAALDSLCGLALVAALIHATPSSIASGALLPLLLHWPSRLAWSGPLGLLAPPSLRSNIDWLMGLPAGLKPNHHLGKKLGGLLLTAVDVWEGWG